MNRQLQFTRKMFDLPIIREGEVYPRLGDEPSTEMMVGYALKLAQVVGFQLRHIVPPWEIEYWNIPLWPGDDVPNLELPELELDGYKLRFLFVLNHDHYGQEFIKGGFLYDTPEQLDEWLGVREQ